MSPLCRNSHLASGRLNICEVQGRIGTVLAMQGGKQSAARRTMLKGMVRAGAILIAALAVSAAHQAPSSAAVLPEPLIPSTIGGAATAPGAPTGLSVTSFTGTTVSLSWTAPVSDGGSPLTKYAVQYRASTTDTWSDAADVVADPVTDPIPTTTTVTGLTKGTKYEFRVGAVNDVGTTWTPGGHGLAVTIYLIDGDYPDKTADGRTACLTATATNLDFTWGDLAPSIGGTSGTCPTDNFMLHATGEITWPGTFDGTTTSTVTLYGSHDDGLFVTVDGVTANDNWDTQGDYLYNSEATVTMLAGAVLPIDVWMYDSGGGAVLRLFWDAPGSIVPIPESAFAAPSQIPSVAPDVTTKPTATPVYPASLAVSWSAPTDNGGQPVTSYQVQHSVDNGGTWLPATPVSVSGTTARLGGLESGSTYKVQVRAVNAAGAGAWTSSDPVELLTTPGPPTDLKVSSFDSTTASLAWTAPADTGGAPLTGYTLQYRALSATEWTTVLIADPATTTATVTGLTESATYVFRVRTANSLGDSAFNVVPTGKFSAASSSSCAVRANGTVACWGANGSGQLGDGTTSNRSTPVDVVGLHGAVSVAVGGSHACAVLANGHIMCWGSNGDGELGDGTTDYRLSLVEVSGITTAVSVSAGDNYTCAVLADGHVKCWGANWDGQLGDGTTDGHSAPALVNDLESAVAVTASSSHACALLSSGSVKCWGSNGDGQLGDGTTDSRFTPTPVVGVSSAVSLSANGTHTCVALADGHVNCWGSNWSGQLGNGTTNASSAPVEVAAISTAEVVTTGDDHSCAVLADGGVKCWGYNYHGNLGDGSRSDSNTPVAVITATGDLAGAITGASGNHHNCVILGDGTLRCWGRNSDGQLGDGSTTRRTSAVEIPTLVAPAYVSVIPSVTPDAPGTPTATPTFPSSLAVTWTAPVIDGGQPVTYYLVEYLDTSGATWLPATPLPVSGTSTTLTGLTAGSTYRVRVTAVNPVGASSATTSGDVHLLTRPGAPTGLTISAFTSTTVSLAWSAPADTGGSPLTGYTVEYREPGAASWTTFETVDDALTTSTITGLSGSTTYEFRVGAINALATTWTPGETGLDVNIYSALGNGPARDETGLTPCLSTRATNLDFNWGTDAPSIGGSSGTCPSDNFLLRATGLINWPGTYDGTTTATVRIYASHDDGLVASVGGTEILNRWYQQGSRLYNQSYEMTLLAGGVYPVDVWMYDNTEGAVLRLFWNASGSIVPIPSSAFAITHVTTDAAVATVPDAPTGVSAVAGAASASVSWSAPLSDGGSAITGYTVTSSPGGLTCSATTSPCTVEGLTNGTEYTFTVKATNTVGDSAASDPSSAVTPATVPDPPTGVSAVAGAGSALVSWSAPAFNGGSAITGYTVTPSADGTPCTTTTELTCTVTGLTNGTSYTFTVKATNAVGDSAASVASDPVIPITVPDAPTSVTAVAASQSATVSWVAPTYDGGSPVTGYTVTSAPGSRTCTTTTELTCAVTGLTNGTSYTFTVTATNAAGTSAASSASSSVTPATVPDPPRSLAATHPSTTSIGLTWLAPLSNGGSALTDYFIEYRVAGDTSWTSWPDAVSTVRTATVTGLIMSTAYEFRVAAVNALGSTWSTPLTSLAATVPGTVTALSVAPASASSLSVTWTAPTSDTGTPLTDYAVAYSANRGGSWTSFADGVSTATSATVTGLTAGSTYLVRVAAVNTIGQGAWVDSTAVVLSVSLTPVFGTIVPSTTGFTVQVTNFSSAYSWTVDVTSGTGTATIDRTGLVTVSRMTAGPTKVTVTTSLAGAVTGSATVSRSATPALASFAPTTATRGTAVTLTGTNLWGATGVTVGGVAITRFTVVNSTTIVFGVPAGVTTGRVVVTTPGGTASSAVNLNISTGTVSPRLTGTKSLSTTSGSVGTPVVVTGTNLGAVTAATLNGRAATFAVVSDTTLVVTVPVGATSGVWAMTTAGGSVSSGTFTVSAGLAAPTITSRATSAKAGTLVNLAGANIGAASRITVNGVATSFAVSGSGTLAVYIPVDTAKGLATIVLTTPGGSVTNSVVLTVS